MPCFTRQRKGMRFLPIVLLFVFRVREFTKSVYFLAILFVGLAAMGNLVRLMMLY